MSKLSIIAVVVALALCYASATSVISSSLLAKLQNGDRATVIVYMKQNPINHLRQFDSMTFQSRSARVASVVASLKSHAEESQREVLAALAEGVRHRAIKVHSLFTSNTVVVHNADLATVETLMSLKDVAEVMEDGAVPVEVMETLVQTTGEVKPQATWGNTIIRADQAWEAGFTGEGVVVAQIDSGIRYTHEALAGRWRADNGWFDPADGSSTPSDALGMGTHSMGTIVGAGPYQVGVAPGASWISCRGCASLACSNADLLKCGDYIACPSGNSANCMAPHIVNNIWGGGQPGNTWYDGVLGAWKSAGIVTTFPAGGGVTCGSIGSPADSNDVFTAGASTPDDDVSAGSSRGPSGSFIKPNVVGPAESTYSSYNTADDAYSTVSGSSYAAAHSAGVFALVRQAAGVDQDVPVSDLVNAVQRGAQKIVASLESCGGIPNNRHPNNVAGHGRLDALGAIEVFLKA